MGSVTEMNTDQQAWGWKTLGFTEKKKKGNIEDLKGLAKHCNCASKIQS